MAFCYQCGKPISEQAKFCPYCGYHLEPKTAKPAPVAEVPIEEEEVQPRTKGKKGKKEVKKTVKGKGKGKSKAAPEETFDIEEDFTPKSQSTVAYTVDRQPTPQPTPVQPEPVAAAQLERTPENPLPSRDGSNVPTLAEAKGDADEDRFGWVWIVVGIIILLIVLVVVWALLFSGYY